MTNIVTVIHHHISYQISTYVTTALLNMLCTGGYFNLLKLLMTKHHKRHSHLATRYGLDGPRIESRWGEIFCCRPDRPWSPPSPPGLKRPRCVSNHSPTNNAEVNECVELYLHTFFGPAWPVIGQISH